MKTISEKTTTGRRFNEAQLLPILTQDMIAGRDDAAALKTGWFRTDTASNRRAVTNFAMARLPRPRAEETTLERVLFGALALSAVVCVGQALAAMIELAPNWPLFEGWVARLLG